MANWPELEPELIERLALAPEAFDAVVDAFIETVPSQPADAAFFERALGYPWERPDGSYVLDGDRVTVAAELDEATRAAFRGGGRVPLLAIGSNGAPSALIRKFGHLAAGDDQRILVETGEVEHLDIGAVATPTWYGAYAATPIESPGTHVRASLLWTTPAQLTALTWSELLYWVGRLDGHPFTPDDGDEPVDGYLLYASRWGALRLGGERLALAAVGARDRSARAVTQRELLDETARLWPELGPGATGDDLIHRLATDHAATRRALAPLLRPLAEPFSPPGWTAFPAR